MVKVIRGHRIGKQGKLSVGCSAVIFDADKSKILLVQRSDGGAWCLPGGRIDAGESVIEACEREVSEETGLTSQVKKLIGIYSDPNIMVEYQDGNQFQIIAFNFEVEVISGSFQINNEVTQIGYFSLDEITSMNVLELHITRIVDAFSVSADVYLR